MMNYIIQKRWQLVSNSLDKPWWLTDDKIKELKEDFAAYPEVDLNNPLEIEYDGLIDIKRQRAETALKILTKYNIPFDDIKEI